MKTDEYKAVVHGQNSDTWEFGKGALSKVRFCGVAVRPRGQVKVKVEVEKERVLRLRFEVGG